MTSIRNRLLVWLLAAVLAGGLVAAGVVFFQARAEANDLFDYQLRQLALTLRDRTFVPSEFAEALQGEEALDFAIQVWGPDGTKLYESHRSLRVPGAVQLGFTTSESPSGRWRIFAIQQRGLTIQVAQPLSVRDRLAIDAALRTLVPFLIALPLMGLLIWRLVGQEMRVLASTATAVARRTPESLEPIATRSVPSEIQPLVIALNGLMSRLGGALSGQRQFIADAAHELRTPLTALKLQLQLAERARNEDERGKAHEMLREGISRAVRLVEQLLALARIDPDAPSRRDPVDLALVARSVVEAHGARAEAAGIALQLDAGSPVMLQGNRGAIETLLDNLVDNALRYTAAGRITVRAHLEGSRPVLEVEDTGPGIPAADRARVFDRFYRGESAPTGGSGLGLAIVKRIAERHGATVALADGENAKGLKVTVTFP